MFGNRQFSDTTDIDHHLTPSLKACTFKSFSAAAAEAAMSRLYGGIHYRFDNEDGLAAGECIGETISKKVKFKLDS